jgi:hypothetical protein
MRERPRQEGAVGERVVQNLLDLVQTVLIHCVVYQSDTTIRADLYVHPASR